MNPPIEYRWRVHGDFSEILSFLGEFVMNREPGQEMRLYSKRLYETDDATYFHFGCDWNPEKMNDVVDHTVVVNASIRSTLVYMGTWTDPRAR